MRKSPDGKREVVDMVVPIEGSVSGTFRVTGLGLPPKLVVGAPALEHDVILDIMNRDALGHVKYDSVDVIRGGMIPLDTVPLQKGDETFAARSGATFGTGKLEAPLSKAGEVCVIDADGGPGPTMAWVITDARSKLLAVVPAAYDSFQLRDALEASMCGEFTVEMITSGSLTATDIQAAPGFRVLVEAPAPHATPGYVN